MAENLAQLFRESAEKYRDLPAFFPRILKKLLSNDLQSIV
ncbi:hypothetical protein LEP1GSC116_1474 [Leptospira interrogans serovar Icterohaemorrhagiae str. Verdun HP]|uniref:Uncharacterized protein n=1 Tax=Leptospira interrogans serovar Icterohaemorrhagiae str. Verdun HP TaxID=1049910 RepID=M6RE49_LEPIR|nr:hypothetical protein LEP1GSC116_1474 [Leptospira interrogans serovar Icterohaemorrhagiae str. Verdun HP]